MVSLLKVINACAFATIEGHSNFDTMYNFATMYSFATVEGR